jgi:hypothetical protein
MHLHWEAATNGQPYITCSFSPQNYKKWRETTCNLDVVAKRIRGTTKGKGRGGGRPVAFQNLATLSAVTNWHRVIRS